MCPTVIGLISVAAMQTSISLVSLESRVTLMFQIGIGIHCQPGRILNGNPLLGPHLYLGSRSLSNFID